MKQALYLLATRYISVKAIHTLKNLSKYLKNDSSLKNIHTLFSLNTLFIWQN